MDWHRDELEANGSLPVSRPLVVLGTWPKRCNTTTSRKFTQISSLATVLASAITNQVQSASLLASVVETESVQQADGRPDAVSNNTSWSLAARLLAEQREHGQQRGDTAAGGHKLLLFALLIVINLSVILGNILVILSVYATAKLRSVTNIFIVSLATADLLLGVFVLPYSLLYEVSREPLVCTRYFEWPLSSLLWAELML